MLKPTRSHQDFQNFIIEQLGIHYFQTNLPGTVLLFHKELARVWITDLTPVCKILASQYSAEKGLLGDPKNLSVAGDGSSVRTGARRYGKMICDCRKQRIFNCRCARRYSDPDASWGWDSYREEYYYGRGIYAFTAADSPYDLPVYLNLFKAQRHDSVAFVSSFFDLLNSYPEFNFGECLLDSAHDAYAIYELLHHYDIGAIIDLNSRNTGKISCGGNFTFTKEGLPVCR